MKLIYLYIDDFEPFHQVEFNFVSDYSCGFRDGMLTVSHKKVLPDHFYSENNDGELFVSAIVGPNGSGKTSVVRFLESLFFLKNGKKFVVVVEAKGELVVYYRWDVKPKVDAQNCAIKDENVINEDAPNEFGAFGQTLRTCFSVVYFSPHYSISSPLTYNSEGAFANLSTTKLLNDVAARVAGTRESAEVQFRAQELKKVIRFYREAQFKLPKPKSILARPQLWRLYEVAGRFGSLQGEEAMRREQLKEGYSHPTLRLDDDEFDRLSRMSTFLNETSEDPFVAIFKCFAAQVWDNESTYVARAYNKKNSFGRLLYESCILNDLSRESCVRMLKERRYSWSNGFDLIIKGRESRRIEDPLLEFFVKLSGLERCSETDRNDALLLSSAGDSQEAEEIVEIYSHCSVMVDFCRFDFDPQQSAGEMALVTMYARLWAWFEDIRSIVAGYDGHDFSHEYMSHWQSGYVVILDEAEITLHPAWQQRLIEDVLRTFNTSFPGFNVHFIFATHSPILLSDIPVGNVVFLDEQHRVLAAPSDMHNTFGASIFNLYRYGFNLVQGSWGSFAERKLSEAFGSRADNDLLVNLIGDDLIRGYLKRHVRTRSFESGEWKPVREDPKTE